MRKHIVSGLMGAIFGALFMFMLIVGIELSQKDCKADENANINTNANSEYTRIEFTTSINEQDCFICGDDRDPLMAHYWKEDNIGILNLNTFDVMYISINRYDINGEQITEPAGVLESSWKICDTSNLHAWTDPDRGYSHIDIPNVTWKIDKSKIQHKLCQNCVKQVNDACIWGKPTEYAVVSFRDKKIRPITESEPWFVFENYCVDSEIEGERINLKVYFRLYRYA